MAGKRILEGAKSEPEAKKARSVNRGDASFLDKWVHLISKGCNLAIFSQFFRKIGSFLPFSGNLWGARASSAPSLKAPLSVNELNHSPLTLAMAAQNYELIKELLDKGANPNEPGFKGHPHIHMATLMDNKKILKLLLDNGANVDSTNSSQNTALHIASIENDIQTLTVLLDHGATIDKSDVRGLTPLQIAVYLGHLNVVQKLLEYNADPNIPMKESDGKTLLHLLVQAANSQEHFDILLELLKHGVDINVQDSLGQTALHKAVLSFSEENNVECVRIVARLLEEPIDLNLRDADGKTALEIAFHKKHHDMTKMIVYKAFQ